MNILISGGAGGIGSAISKYFIDKGYKVYSIDVSSNNELGENFVNFDCDVTNLEELHNLKNKLKDIKFDHILTLAGRAISDEWVKFSEIKDESILESINLNLCGQINVVKVFFDSLNKECENRSIILMSSINAFGGFGLPFYSAAKLGLVGFARTVKDEFKDKGVRINVIAPGTIVTPATEEEPKDFSALLKTTSSGKFATKEEVSKLAYDICNNKKDTGKVFVIDAGQMKGDINDDIIFIR